MLTGNYITPIPRSNPLKSKEDFNRLLKFWVQRSVGNTIGDPDKHSGNTVIIWVRISDRLYKVNADTSRKGVKKYLENYSNGNTNWTQVRNSGRISNNEDGTLITNFAMYKH